MRIKIDDQYRDVCILPAPKGSFFLTEECSPQFPNFVALTEPIGDESSYGDIVICPITDYNGGHASCSINELHNELTPGLLKTAIEYAEVAFGEETTETGIINRLMDGFEAHGTPILKFTRDWIKKRLDELSKE